MTKAEREAAAAAEAAAAENESPSTAADEPEPESPETPAERDARIAAHVAELDEIGLRALRAEAQAVMTAATEALARFS